MPSRQPTVSVWATNGWPVSCVPAFRTRCRQAGVEGSMGRRGDAYDNAVAESFFALDFDVMRSWSTRHPGGLPDGLTDDTRAVPAFKTKA